MPTAKFCTREQLLRLSTAVLWKRIGGAKKRKAIGSGHVADLQAIRDKDRQRELLIEDDGQREGIIEAVHSES